MGILGAVQRNTEKTSLARKVEQKKLVMRLENIMCGHRLEEQ